MFGHGYLGAGYFGPGYWGPGVSVPDTHDGFDEDSYRHAKKVQARKDKDFRSARERLRTVLERAWGEPEPGPVAAEVKALAAPYVDILESGALRIDHVALESRNATVMAELLAFQDALRAEFAERMTRFEEDEEDVMLLTQWM
jgi:hypothetical protein